MNLTIRNSVTASITTRILTFRNRCYSRDWGWPCNGQSAALHAAYCKDHCRGAVRFSCVSSTTIRTKHTGWRCLRSLVALTAASSYARLCLCSEYPSMHIPEMLSEAHRWIQGLHGGGAIYRPRKGGCSGTKLLTTASSVGPGGEFWVPPERGPSSAAFATRARRTSHACTVPSCDWLRSACPSCPNRKRWDLGSRDRGANGRSSALFVNVVQLFPEILMFSTFGSPTPPSYPLQSLGA
jgi:hypothetical protein